MQRVDLFRPPINRATKLVDRGFFQKEIPISAGRVLDTRSTWRLRKELEKSNALLSVRNIAQVQQDPERYSCSNSKCLLLAPSVNYKDSSTWNSTVKSLVESGELSLFPYKLQLCYNNWTACTYMEGARCYSSTKDLVDEILSSMLPEDLLEDIPTAFSKTGHVAHLNLRESYLPYKHIIAQVLIDKNPGIQTVINKRDTLNQENKFRVLDYEVLAGEDNLLVEVKEDNCTYRFDFSKVFWNTRLGTEHRRVIDSFQAGEAVCDVMAGVGPFAIPAGKKGVFVWANDLNPHCYESLKGAISINKVCEFVRPFNEDGHSFIRNASARLLHSNYSARVPLNISRRKAASRKACPEDSFKVLESPKVFSHYIMNLPDTAIEFLPSFIGLYAGHEHLFMPHTPQPLPTIQCYCFGSKKGDDTAEASVESQICKRISEKLKFPLDRNSREVTITEVRDVAPNKRQYRVTFVLPTEVAFREQ